MKPVLGTIIFTIVVPGAAAVYLPCRITPGLRTWPPAGAMAWAGIAVVLFGLALYLRCAFAFAIDGRGTPAPLAPTRALVARGPYRWVRNPMYVGVLGVLAGEVLYTGSWRLFGYTCLIGAGFVVFVRLYEEPALRRQFGDSYRRYCEAVPRWIPRRRQS